MVQYIIQIIAFQVFFLLIYDVFLKKETFFNWNRIYLIGTSIVSLILPFIKVTAFNEIVPKDYIVTLPEIFIGNKIEQTTQVVLPEIEIVNQGFSWSMETIFYLGLIVASLLFIFKIAHICLLIYKNPKRWKGNVLLVKLINSTSAFSFFHYVFLGSYLKEEEQKVIIKHELVHVTQKHTLDLLFFEAQRILFWFNPLVYMYQARVRSLHEYIADQEALKTQDKSDYYQNLLTQIFETENVSFINAFFKKSLIKKRIMMLSKSKSKQIVKLKYALLIPVVFAMLVFTTNAQTNSVTSTDTNTQELTFEQLVEKYYQDFLEMEEQGVNIFKSYSHLRPMKEKYIVTKDEYAQFDAFGKYILKNSVKRKREDGTLEQKDLDMMNSMLNKRKNYHEYLEWKKTDKAKELWENNSHDGVLRLVVDDFSKLTEEEKKEEQSKKELLFRDDFFHKLIVTDGYNSYSIEQPIDNASKETETTTYESVEIPFAVIENVPVFPGCELLETNEEQRKCMSEKITKHVLSNFNVDLANKLELTGRQTIRVMFKINKEGNIEGAKARAPHPKLEEEAKRVISALPKMIPGKHKGETVIVPYSLPIIFEVAEKTDKKSIQQKTVLIDEVEVPYAVIEQPPMFKECETLSTIKEQRKCTSDAISKHVQKNFNVGLAKSLGLTGRQTIRVLFKIDQDGNITGVRSRAPHPQLEEEAIRVIQSLPEMIPGKHKDEAVIVPYSLPIIFEVKESPNAIISYLTTENSNFRKDVEKQELTEVPFAVIDELPIYPGCENKTTRDELKKCTTKGISDFVLNEFGKNLPKNIDSELEPRQKILAMFKIDKTGYIESIRARAKHPELEQEAIRVLKALPKMTPGKHKGKTVIVPYSVPIIYELGKKKN